MDETNPRVGRFFAPDHVYLMVDRECMERTPLVIKSVIFKLADGRFYVPVFTSENGARRHIHERGASKTEVPIKVPTDNQAFIDVFEIFVRDGIEVIGRDPSPDPQVTEVRISKLAEMIEACRQRIKLRAARDEESA